MEAFHMKLNRCADESDPWLTKFLASLLMHRQTAELYTRYYSLSSMLTCSYGHNTRAPPSKTTVMYIWKGRALLGSGTFAGFVGNENSPYGMNGEFYQLCLPSVSVSNKWTATTITTTTTGVVKMRDETYGKPHIKMPYYSIKLDIQIGQKRKLVLLVLFRWIVHFFSFDEVLCTVL